MSWREHDHEYDVSDAEWADRRDDGGQPLVRLMEDQINDLAAQLLEPDLPADTKQAIRAQAAALRGMCALLES